MLAMYRSCGSSRLLSLSLLNTFRLPERINIKAIVTWSLDYTVSVNLGSLDCNVWRVEYWTRRIGRCTENEAPLECFVRMVDIGMMVIKLLCFKDPVVFHCRRGRFVEHRKLVVCKSYFLCYRIWLWRCRESGGNRAQISYFCCVSRELSIADRHHLPLTKLLDIRVIDKFSGV